jgi:thiol-disulfide isomerase/thioredoxin
MKKTLVLIISILMIVACFTACGNTGDNGDNGDTSTTSQGSDAILIPEESLEGVEHGSFKKFTAVDLAGNKVTEDIFKGKKLTMINIWATFCRPCIGEMPDLAQLNTEYADKDFQVIGIVCDVSYSGDGYEASLLSDANNIIEMTGVNYTNLLPSQSLDMIKLSEVYSVPETIFVDEDGNIVGTSYVGSRSIDDWKSIVDNTLASMDK